VRLGIRSRLFVVSLLVIVLGLGLAGGWLELDLRAELETRTEQQLERTCLMARDALELEPLGGSGRDWQAVAERLGPSALARITVVGADGKVLGDSGVERGALATMENHANRPEVAAALLGGHGLDRRRSSTLKTDMLYVAVPFDDGARRGAVRAALSLGEIDQAVHALRLKLLFAGAVALVLAAFMSGLSAHYLSQTVRELVDVARRMAGGEAGRRARAARDDELGGLAGSLNTLASSLEHTVTDLARERDQFSAVLEAMAEAVVALDHERRVTLCNRAALELLQWPEAPTGRPLVELIRQPALHELVSRTLREGSAGNTHDGATVDPIEAPLGRGARVLVRATRLGFTAGDVLLVMRDVSELRRLEAVRRDFVANVSHELRTPVSTIRANAETLLGGALDDREHAERFLGAILRNAERLSRILADLLDLSRIEAGRYALELHAVPIRATAARAVELVVDRGRAKGISVTLEIAADASALGDDDALEHVLVNLLDNAVKHASSRVTVQARETELGLRLEVRDDGPGVEPRFRTRIFQRFYRIDPGRSRELGGTGLGLSIVKHLVEAMQGRVGVEDNSPHGAVFFVELPRAATPIGKAAPA
jgi:two-component system phosphate regulon sensor histidine kinase PhoR